MSAVELCATVNFIISAMNRVLNQKTYVQTVRHVSNCVCNCQLGVIKHRMKRGNIYISEDICANSKTCQQLCVRLSTLSYAS